MTTHMADTRQGMTYASTGVDYSLMDPHKVESTQAGMRTDKFAEKFGFKVVPWTRGESVFLVETPWGYIGFVVEGLGTKNLVADGLSKVAAEMHHFTGKSFYDKVAVCNAAMAFNDCITLGARPFIYGQYLGVGDSSWFKNDARRRDLIRGTALACELAGCVWGGGETPTLLGIIFPSTTDLAGATVGIVADKRQLIDPANIKAGDAIVMVESSGIHANGLSMAREIAAKISPDPKRPELGYLEKLPSGRTFGETLLDPTHIYVELVSACLDAGVRVHYTVNITGHGWRKLMRARQEFSYLIEQLPTEQEIFSFMQERGPVSDAEAYGNWNMGAGFALYVEAGDSEAVVDIAKRLGLRAFWAGRIENGEKKVVIRPKNDLTFHAKDLQVRK